MMGVKGDLQTSMSDRITKQLDDPALISARENPMADLLIGFELSERYRIIRLIGSGGWGNVYLSKHLTLGTDLAIKVLHKHLSQNEQSLRRLDQEAKLLSQLESPHIVRIMDYSMEPFPFIQERAVFYLFQSRYGLFSQEGI
jgi:serine/threonine protein kinase